MIIEFYCTTEFRIIIGFIIDKENLVLPVLSNGKLFSKLFDYRLLLSKN